MSQHFYITRVLQLGKSSTRSTGTRQSPVPLLLHLLLNAIQTLLERLLLDHTLTNHDSLRDGRKHTHRDMLHNLKLCINIIIKASQC